VKPEIEKKKEYEYQADLEWTECPVCGGWDMDFMYNLNYTYILSVERCKKCGMVTLNPKHSWQWLLDHYPVYKPKDTAAILEPSYFTALAEWSEFKGVGFIWKLWWRYIDLFAKPLEKDIPGENSRVFDYVCRDGRFLKALKEKSGFKKVELHGAETRPSFIQYAEANGVKVFFGKMEDASYPDNYFDVIYMRHMIEHLANPRVALREVYRTLKPGGLLRIECPNIDSISEKIFKRNYYGFWPLPRHIHMFSPKTLPSFLESEGFEIERVCCTPGNPYLYHSMIPALKDIGWRKPAGLLEKKYVKAVVQPLLVPVSSVAALFKKGDELVILSRKKRNSS
jgi:SAM-dependent methyltransferase